MKYEAAFREFQELSGKGDTRGYNGMGFLYHNGLGVHMDHQMAFKLFELSVEQGNAACQFDQCASYLFGFGVDQDFGKAIEWLRVSADQN